MKWIKIAHDEIDGWNEKLKSTNASFFQYPYYAFGYKHFFLSRPVYLKLVDEKGNELSFCTVLEIGFYFFKVGLIIRGPVLLNENPCGKFIFDALKIYAKKNNYSFLRINPDSLDLEILLKEDPLFIRKDFFPIYKGSQSKNLNVYEKNDEELLKSFQPVCRQKIKYANEINFTYNTVSTQNELKETYNLFATLEKTKKFRYRPYESYKEIFINGSKHNLCSVYTAKIENELVCCAFIVKDKVSYTYMSGALIIKGFKPKNSPANNLHYLAMRECFYKEHKQYYNLSYSDPSSTVFVFKNSFHPSIEDKPDYYTYIVNRRLSKFILSLQEDKLKQVKHFLRRIIKLTSIEKDH
jgi:hypothetical protein